MSDPLKDLRQRQRFILDNDDLELLAESAKPRLLTMEDQRSPQEISNEAWQLVAAKHEFVWDSVRPSADTLDRGIIQAIPLNRERVQPPLPIWAMLPSANDTE